MYHSQQNLKHITTEKNKDKMLMLLSELTTLRCRQKTEADSRLGGKKAVGLNPVCLYPCCSILLFPCSLYITHHF